MSSYRGLPVIGRLIVIVVALALPACSGTSSQRTSEAADTEPARTGSPASVAEGSVDLSGVCPDPLVIQTDWAPESEYGAVYGLLGDHYTVDRDTKRVTGSLTASGQDTGIDVEIRAGGASISGGVSDVMYFDESVTFGLDSTDGQILRWGRMPLLSVVAPLEINPQMIMWDPQTYPGVKTLADLGEEGVTVNVFGGPSSTFSEVLVAMGFRAVHDIVGHALLGAGFDRNGEYAAWRFQERFHSALARRALATELHAKHSVCWTMGEPPDHRALLIDPQLLQRSRRAGRMRTGGSPGGDPMP